MTVLRLMIATKFMVFGLLVVYATTQMPANVAIEIHAAMLVIGLSSSLLGTAMVLFEGKRA